MKPGRSTIIGVIVLILGVVATTIPTVNAAQSKPGYEPASALFLAAGVMLLVTALLFIRVPRGDAKVPLLRLLWLGSDNRASTSKCVALAWTYAIVWGMLALLALKLMGDSSAWNELNAAGLQEDYLLLLGGPFAAAVIAKYTVVATGESNVKASAPEGGGSVAEEAKNLIANDDGRTDLGDFQYVLFNLVALAFFLGTFIPAPRAGFPALPSLLVGLALTSAATYNAKKAATVAAAPQIATVFPTTARVGDNIDLYGRSLGDDAHSPHLSIDGIRVSDDAIEVLSPTHIAFTVPRGIPRNGDVHQVRLVTDNGTEAQGPRGTDYLPLKLLAP